MSEHNCGSCRHAKLAERPVGSLGTPAYWIDRSGRCALADAYVVAASEYLALCPSGKRENLPVAFLGPAAKVIAPSHGIDCSAWEAR